jgi:hypothetical protein
MWAVTHIEHIVLDLDGTLIGEDHICARPYLTEFLCFCFEHFESVNIWTAASQEWWIECFNKYIRKCLPLRKIFIEFGLATSANEMICATDLSHCQNFINENGV